MRALRSRTGVVSITAGVAVVLSLPAVAAAQVPAVDQVVRAAPPLAARRRRPRPPRVTAAYGHAAPLTRPRARVRDESADERAGTDVASEAADAPSDAGVETLPFTGLQLALVLASGLAALGGGLLLRRSARTGGR